MIEELIYTSAPRGLKPGSKGFCTVASTAGMAHNLASQLESLSGYRHLAAPGDTSGGNPVVHSHLKVRLGGRDLSILSRIADAGLDYSGRSNKIAHHVVLNAQKLSPAGPAAIQSHPGFHQSSWSGDARVLDTGRPVPQVTVEPAICETWKSLTGDAGWGGVLAHRLAQRESPQQWMIYPLGVDPLRLVNESLALIPPAARWQITYTTYYTSLPPGVDCRLRCVPDGTAEAQQLRKRHELQVIDLCKPLGPPAASRLVEVARTGLVTEVARQDELRTLPSAIGTPANVDDFNEVDLNDITSTAPPPLPFESDFDLPQDRESYTRRTTSSSRKSLWVATAIVLLILAGTGAAGYFVFPEVVAKVLRKPTDMASSNEEATASTPEGELDDLGHVPDPVIDDSQMPVFKSAPDISTDEISDSAIALTPEEVPADLQEQVDQVTKQADDIPDNGPITKEYTEPDEAEASTIVGDIDATDSLLEEDVTSHLALPQEPVFLSNLVSKGTENVQFASAISREEIELHFFYPKTSDPPYHLVSNDDAWIICLSQIRNPEEPEDSQQLVRIKLHDDNLEIQRRPLLEKHAKYQDLIARSYIKLAVLRQPDSPAQTRRLQFSKAKTEETFRPDNSAASTESLFSDLKLWKQNWITEDRPAGTTYFLRSSSSSSAPIKFTRQTLADLGQTQFLISTDQHLSVHLDILLEPKGENKIGINLSWRIEPHWHIPGERGLLLTQSGIDQIATAIKKVERLETFRSKYSQALGQEITTWQEIHEELKKDLGDTKLQTLNQKSLKEMREEFNRIGNPMVPANFDPDACLEFLRNIQGDLELGIELTSSSNKSQTDPEDLELILKTTIPTPSADEKE